MTQHLHAPFLCSDGRTVPVWHKHWLFQASLLMCPSSSVKAPVPNTATPSPIIQIIQFIHAWDALHIIHLPRKGCASGSVGNRGDHPVHVHRAGKAGCGGKSPTSFHLRLLPQPPQKQTTRMGLPATPPTKPVTQVLFSIIFMKTLAEEKKTVSCSAQ